MISKNSFQLYSSILGLSAPADSDGGGGVWGGDSGEGGKFSHGIKALLPGAALCPHGLCSAGLSQIIQIID